MNHKDAYDRVIAEKLYGWKRKLHIHPDADTFCHDNACEWWEDDGRPVMPVADFHPSADYNRLREAEMRLSEEQRVEYGWRLAEKLDLMPANDCISVPIDVLDLFKILTAPAAVRAVAMAEMLEGK